MPPRATTTTRQPRAAKAPETRTLLVHTSKFNAFRLTIPASARVTYGDLHPGSKEYRDRSNGNVLRVYEGQNQTAVFQNVFAFRDMAYPYEEQVVVVESESTSDSKGNEKKNRRVTSNWDD